MLTGEDVPPDLYNLYINGLGPIAWTMAGMSELRQAVKVEGTTAVLTVNKNRVTSLTYETARKK